MGSLDSRVLGTSPKLTVSSLETRGEKGITQAKMLLLNSLRRYPDATAVVRDAALPAMPVCVGLAAE